MYQTEFWRKKNSEYKRKYGIDKPNIFAQEVLRYFPPRGSLLDLAAGIGQDSWYFAKQGFQVTSTEYSQSYLKNALDQAKDEDLNINFQLVDLSKKFNLKKTSFDIAYCHLGLHYFKDKETRNLFKEIHRVLKKGGIFASIFNTIDDPQIKILKDREIEKNLYLSFQEVSKRFFSLDYLKDLNSQLFDPIILDNRGRTYKDGDNAKLIRFIARKI